MTDTEQYQVVIVGAGFAGIACAKELAKHDVVRLEAPCHTGNGLRP